MKTALILAAIPLVLGIAAILFVSAMLATGPLFLGY